MKYLLGLDNGSTMIKAGIFDMSGKELGVFSDRADTVSPHPGWYERDLETLWQANVTAVRGAIKAAGIAPEDIAAVSLTGHGNGAILVDAEGQPVRNAIEGADSRALSYIKRFEEAGYYEKVHCKNMQVLWPALSIVVMAWLRDNEPEAYKKARYFFNVHDYVRFRLTGEAFAEISDISGTGLINTRDRCVDREMLAVVGLEEMADKIPPLKGSFEQAGCVTAAAAELTGLAAGTTVYAGTYDIDAAALATGSVDESRICLITGTWANNQYIGAKPVVAQEFFSTTVFSRPGYWLMLEGSPTSASNLEWFVTEFLQEEKKQAKAAGTSVYDICNRAVAETDPEETDLIFIPYLYGSNTSPIAKACFIGLQGWHQRKHVIRAIYEGICFSHRYHIEKLLNYLTPPEAARISGGGAKSREWSQMFADVLQMPVEIPSATELGTLGACMCAGVGAGLFPDAESVVRAMVGVSGTIQPNPAKKDIYDRKYRNFLRAIRALEAYWEEDMK